MFSFWDKLFKKKPQYDIEALRREASRYLAENYKPPKPVVPVSEKPAKYSISEGRPPQKPAQFQMIDDSFDRKEDPLAGVWQNYLTDAEARALGIVLKKPRERTFSEMLVQLIRERGYRDPEVYRRAQIDRRLFSKIVGNRLYRPAKDTVIAFAFALRCSLEETNRLLSSAGFLLSNSSRRDMLIEWLFEHQIYDLTAVNEILDGTGEKIIGRENVG